MSLIGSAIFSLVKTSAVEEMSKDISNMAQAIWYNLDTA